MPTVQETVVATLGGMATGGFGIWLKYWLDNRKKHTVPETIADMAAVYDVLQEAERKFGVERALVLYTSNGGGIPSPTNTVTTTILYELVAGDGLYPIRKDWQHVPIDQGYVRLLNLVINDGYWEGTPDDLEDGFLKTLYKSEGITYSCIFEVARTEKKYFYASFRWKDHRPPNAQTLSMMRAVMAVRLKVALGVK